MICKVLISLTFLIYTNYLIAQQKKQLNTKKSTTSISENQGNKETAFKPSPKDKTETVDWITQKFDKYTLPTFPEDYPVYQFTTGWKEDFYKSIAESFRKYKYSFFDSCSKPIITLSECFIKLEWTSFLMCKYEYIKYCRRNPTGYESDIVNMGECEKIYEKRLLKKYDSWVKIPLKSVQKIYRNYDANIHYLHPQISNRDEIETYIIDENNKNEIDLEKTFLDNPWYLNYKVPQCLNIVTELYVIEGVINGIPKKLNFANIPFNFGEEYNLDSRIKKAIFHLRENYCTIEVKERF